MAKKNTTDETPIEPVNEPETEPVNAAVDAAPGFVGEVPPPGNEIHQPASVAAVKSNLEDYSDETWSACLVWTSADPAPREVRYQGSTYEHCANDPQGRWIYNRA